MLARAATAAGSPTKRMPRVILLALAACGCTGMSVEESRDEEAQIRPNMELPEPDASGRNAAAAVLDLTHNVMWFEDARGQPTHAPQDESEIERLVPARVTIRGSLSERYHGLTPDQRRRRMNEVTRVMRCEYENACLTIVHRMRGAPGDPQGFTGEEKIKAEGSVLPFTLP